jgi:hypothetical protein
MTYDPNNVFAKVLRGELPCHKIYEDEDTLAFLDIMPRAEGHALVITKEKARWCADRAVQRRGSGPDRVPPARPHHPAQRGHGA